MAEITLHGNPVKTIGSLPAPGEKAPRFSLVQSDLSVITLEDLRGKNIILNIFPSLDTSTCAASVRRFNTEAGGLKDTVILCVSADLPFAAARFCAAEGLKNVKTASVFRSPEFGRLYGVTMTSGLLTGLLSRALVIIGQDGKIHYTQQVPEISSEPDYAPALNALR